MENQDYSKSLAFKYEMDGRELSFILPMNEDKLYRVFEKAYKNKEISLKDVNITQLRMTGWRIIKNWVESQMALIEIELVLLIASAFKRVNHSTLVKSKSTLIIKFEQNLEIVV